MSQRTCHVPCRPSGRRRFRVYYGGMDSAHPEAHGELGPLFSPGEKRDPTLRFRGALRAEDLIGRSPPMTELAAPALAAGPLDVSVLLTGPSGTGKTHVARVIHASSPRAAVGNFVELSCANLPDNLVESELFGAAPGAHSTAVKAVEGKVYAARGGTLLFDEIAELSLPAQAKLLQLLQSREYYPLGANRPRAADVRVIAATNCDLKARVARREFREDLFYRLHVVPIRVPSLAERRDDIPELAQHFCITRLHAPPPARCTCPNGHSSPPRPPAGPATSASSPTPSRPRSSAPPARTRARSRRVTCSLTVRTGTKAHRPAQLPRGAAPLPDPAGPRHLEDSNWNVAEAARRLAPHPRAHLQLDAERSDISRP